MASTAESIRAVAEHVGPAVVRVGRGSGVVVGDGRVLTNAHNVQGGEVHVRFADGRLEPATLAAADVDGDLAVLDVDTGDATVAAWGDAGGLGDEVFAVVGTRGGPRVTVGRVSAVGQAFRGPRGRPIHDAIEHTAPMGRGSSGGPIVDADGRVVGVNTHRRGDGFYLAVPATAELTQRVEELATGQTRERARLGIAVTPAHVAKRMRAAVGLDDRPGLLVRGVGDGSPAEAADVRRGDLIVSADGEPIEHGDDLFARLESLSAGDALTLGLVRGSEELEVTVTF